jgi:peptide/nickel transport system substrate-binding protein
MSSPCRLVFATLTLVLTVTWLAAQPPRKEEEEEPPAKEKAKARPVVPVPVTEPEKKDGPPTSTDPIDPDIGTFKEEIVKTTNPDAKELFRELMVPYDRIDPNFDGGFRYNIELLRERELPEGEFSVNILDKTRVKVLDTKKIATGTGFKYVPFELIVLEKVNAFVEKEPLLDRLDQLDLAARAVAAGLRWHLHAKDTNKRQGGGWDSVTRQMKYRLLELQRDRFAGLLSAGKYDEADKLGLKMLSRNPDNSDIMLDVYRLNLVRVDRAAKAPTDAQLLQLRESLIAYQRLHGKKDETLIQSVQRRLRNRAIELVARAKEADQQKKAAEALAILRTAETFDPDAPGIEDNRIRLRGKVLYVGVSKLPERMSPATATTDAEKWAVELMFEGLLETVPDSEVIRYRPALAETMPAVMPLGRSFTLPRNSRWSREPGEVVDARDVRGTLNLLRDSKLQAEWAAEGVDVFEAIDRIDDQFRLRLAYRQGVLEPLARATFKVIPARYLLEQGKPANDDGFARAPFGSGPFRYEGREKEGLDRECAVFRSNPFYGQRTGRIGLPWIREVRMFVPTPSTVARDVSAGQLHIYPDAPIDMAARFKDEPGLKEVMRVRNAQSNRRIHILAVNHRVTGLQNEKVRQGLAAVVNRDAILKAVYRGGDDRAHAALSGPFPVKSWATPPTAKDAPLSKPGGGGLIAEGLNNSPIRLRLTFNRENTQAKAVCDLIKMQIEQGTLNKEGKPLIEVDLKELSDTDYKVKLYVEHDFDLALATFDYHDDLYSLAGLLDPDAIGPDGGRGGRNFLGYLTSGTGPTDNDRRLRRLIEETRQSRDFSKKVQQKTWDIHALFNQRMPFVPLWQLDRYMAVHKDLEMFFDNPDAPVSADQLDPAVVFTGTEMWRVK